MLPIPTGLRVPAACGRCVFGAAPLVLPALIFGMPRSHLRANARRPPAPLRSHRFLPPDDRSDQSVRLSAAKLFRK